MSLSSSEVWQRLEREELAVGAERQHWARQIAESLDESQRGHGLKVLQRLIELKRLTSYQAKILAGQATGPLRLGRWTVLQPVADTLWPNWLVVRPTSEAGVPSASSTAADALLWALPVDAQRLRSLRAAAPSLPRAQRLAAIEHQVLQRTMLPEQFDGQLLLLVAPLKGQLLSEKFAGQASAAPLAFELVRQVAGGLAALHRQGIAHGRVLPDRIYWQQDQVVLAVDPLCAVSCPVSDKPAIEKNSGLLAQRLEATQALQWMAPEFQVAGQCPTPSTDVYSLGCLWWWLLTGGSPAAGNSASEIWQKHSAPPPPLPSGCEITAGQWRCLQHALARNRSARFASAEVLLRALEAIDVPRAQVSRSQAVDVVPIVKPAESSIGTSPLPLAIPDSQPRSPVSAPAADRQLELSPRALRRRRPRRPVWFVPVLAGCGLLTLLLIGLGLSGALQPVGTTARSQVQATSVGSVDASAAAGTTAARDPREVAYRIVDSDPQLLWVPPALPNPLPLDLLPPGGQLFISFRPAELLDDSGPTRRLLAAFDRELSPMLNQVGTWAGLPPEEIAHICAAFYPSLTPGGWPQVCLRVELQTAKPLGDLKRAWQSASSAEEITSEEVAGQMLLVINPLRTYYVTPQPLLDSQSVRQFSLGPVELMRDAAELQGQAGPLVPQLERLWSNSDQLADLSLFTATAFLLTEGRGLLAAGPPRFTEYLRHLLTDDLRGVGLQMRFDPAWYVEARFSGADALKAGKLSAAYEQSLRSLPSAVESQLVTQTPDPYWRALALRFPHMLRTFADHSRFGVENDTVIANTYLPSEAASNVLLAGWLALHDFGGSSSPSVSAAGPSAAEGNAPWSIDAYLDRPISLSFEQEPIEVALSLVAAEANDQLPAATAPLRFELDGDAFEKAGITRNQQLRNFRLEGRPVRQALTEIAKRGNPVANVSDTRQSDQRLVWVVAPDAEQAAGVMILLTTRTAAQAAGIELPAEFRP